MEREESGSIVHIKVSLSIMGVGGGGGGGSDMYFNKAWLNTDFPRLPLTLKIIEHSLRSHKLSVVIPSGISCKMKSARSYSS